MSELTTSKAEPAYISRLALHSIPFHDVFEPKDFFKGGQFDHRLNLLLHLVRATNKVGLLVAADGQGKTSLLSQLNHRSGDELRISLVNGHVSANSQAVMASCLKSLGVSDSEIKSSNNHTATFKNRLKQLRKLNVKPLLLINNADTLTEEFLETLSIWLSWKDDERYLLQAVIVSNKALELEGDAQLRLQDIDLPVLAEQDLERYLDHKLMRAGYQGEKLFSEKVLKRMYSKSLGNLTLINQLAHQHLLGFQSPLSEPSGIKLNSVPWMAVSVVVILLVLLLSYQADINQWMAQQNPDIEIDEPTIIEVQEPELATIIVDNKSTTSDNLQREELADLLANIPEPELEVMPHGDEATINLVELVPNVSEPGIYKHQWVLQQQATHYTFQLMGSWDKQEVHEFIEQYALTGDVALFESLRSGRVWYALIYGSYNNKQAALAASSQWSAPLNTLPSWLRRFDSVQKQIKNTASTL